MLRELIRNGLVRVALRRARRGRPENEVAAIDNALDNPDVFAVVATYAYDEFCSQCSADGTTFGSVLDEIKAFFKWLVESGTLAMLIQLLLAFI
jgi:hypothetical protein